MRLRHVSVLLSLALLGMVGCAALQRGVDSAVGWIDSPATTRPGAPTNGQVIQTTVDTASPFLPGWGTVASGLVAGGFLVLRKLSSRDHATIGDKVDAVADVVKTVAESVKSRDVAKPTRDAP